MIFTRSPLKESKEENLHLNSSYETNLESAVPSLFAYPASSSLLRFRNL